jgi:folate-binding protein YgfZ
MRQDWRLAPELDLGVLRAQGPDAVAFLQGQLSSDVTRLSPGALQLAGYHNPQGRVIALLRLTALTPQDLLAVLPRELVAPVAAKLKRFVLRAKVQISDASAQWQILGFQGPAPAVPAGALALPHGAARQLVLIPQGVAAPEVDTARGTAADWIAADIEEGLPEVHLATSEAFVAQMLNLDVLGGIAFDKGCYTGQEIIARAHYRGHVKRRMQRFDCELPCELAPGASGVLADGRGFKVVSAVATAHGRCEFLAVTHFAQAETEATESAAPRVLTARQLPLPYALPDNP